jgi:peptidoglycan hydrolase-like protein with peptidoglycan-binding domain
MRNMTLPILLAASLAATAPASAQTDFGDIVSGVAQSLLEQELDRNAYIEAQNRNTVEGYRTYLAQFPKGAYRGNARQALAKLGASAEPGNPPPVGGGSQSAAAVEASIGLSRTQRIQIQKQLTSVGYSTGVADGLWGSRTRSAITRWQTANKLAATGYVTARQVRLIAEQAGPGVGTDPGGPVAGDDQVEERLLGLTYEERREVQRLLTQLGYNTWGADGVFGRNTRAALATWQRDEGLRVSGYLTADQLRELRRQRGA